MLHESHALGSCYFLAPRARCRVGGVAVHRKIGRREFLKAASYSAAGLAGLAGGGLLAFSEYSSRQNLAGIDHVLGLLGSMQVRPRPARPGVNPG